MENALKQNNIFYFVFSLLLFYGMNNILDLIIVSSILAYILFAKEETAYYAYIFLLPWDMVVYAEGIGSIFRPLQIIILLKFIYSACRDKELSLTMNSAVRFLLFGYMAIYAILAFNNGDISILGIILNLLIIWIMQSKGIFENLKFFDPFIYSVVLGIIYGLVNNNFMQGWIDGIGIINRFSGLFEPNFMGLYINIAIYFITFRKIYDIKNLICLAILIIGLFMTVSITGIGVFLIILTINNWKELTKILKKLYVSLPLLAIGSYFLYKMNLFHYIFVRIEDIVKAVSQGNFKLATSNRTSLSQVYIDKFYDFPLMDKIFGKAINSKDYINNIMPRNVIESHNSNIDILYMFGLLGLILFAFYFIYESFIKKKAYKFTVLKLVILIYSFSLSMFTGKIYFFFLII